MKTNIDSQNISQKNLEEFVQVLQKQKYISDEDWKNLLDLVKSMSVIKGSQHEFSGEFMQNKMKNFVDNPQDFDSSFITRTYFLRDIAEKYVKSCEKRKRQEKIDAIFHGVLHRVSHFYENVSQVFTQWKSGVKAQLKEISSSDISEIYKEAEASARRFLDAGFQPYCKVQMGGYEFFLCKQANEDRKDVIGYVKKNWHYEPRWFYFSKSAGVWKSSPGIRSDLGYSKWEKWWVNYETGTNVSDELSHILDGLSTDNNLYIDKNSNIDHIKKNRYFSDSNYQSDASEINLIPFSNDLTADWQLKKGSLENMRNVKIHPQFLTKEKIQFSHIKLIGTHYHNGLGALVASYSAILKRLSNEQAVEIIFSHAPQNNPEQFWVENIIMSPQEINSFGVLKNSILSGILTAKPLEYRDTLRKQFTDVNILYELPVYSWEYVDIRPFLQENPLIKEFKKHI